MKSRLLERKRSLCVDYQERRRERKPWEMKPRGEKRWRDEDVGKHGRRREGDREFATYLEMNERDRRWRKCIAVGRHLRLSTPSPLEVGFRFEFFSQFVFAKVFNRDSNFKDYLGFFFLISVHGHISSHKAYAFFLERKRHDQSAPQSRLTGKGIRLLGASFNFLRLKAICPRLALRCLSRHARETPLKTLVWKLVIFFGLWDSSFLSRKNLREKRKRKKAWEFRKKEVKIKSSSKNCRSIELQAIGFCILHLLFRF